MAILPAAIVFQYIHIVLTEYCYPLRHAHTHFLALFFTYHGIIFSTNTWIYLVLLILSFLHFILHTSIVISSHHCCFICFVCFCHILSLTHTPLSFSSLFAFLLTCRTIFLWMANFAMMWARSKWPLYLQAGSTQALGSRHGQAKVMRRRSLLLRDLLLSWMWWGACSTSRVENCSRQIRSESSRSACFSGSRTLERDGKNVGLKTV